MSAASNSAQRDGLRTPESDKPDRKAQIIRLLDTRNDNLPLPTRRDEQASRGFVHHSIAVESCPDCLANDRVMFSCETCHGRGVIESPREHDPYAIEKDVKPFGFDVSLHERRRERDAELARLSDQTRDPWKSESDVIADANKHPYGWEVARKAMYRDYDYRALDVALEKLRATHPGTDPYSDFGLVFLSTRLPSPLRVPKEIPTVVNLTASGRHADPKALKQRNARMRELADEGASPEEIATICGVSTKTVYRVVAT